MILFTKDARSLVKSIDVLDDTFIVLLLSQVTVDRLKYSFSCERFVEPSLLVQCAFNLSERWNFSEVYVLFKKFFLHESQPAGPTMKTKKVNVE